MRLVGRTKEGNVVLVAKLSDLRAAKPLPHNAPLTEIAGLPVIMAYTVGDIDPVDLDPPQTRRPTEIDDGMGGRYRPGVILTAEK